ncbi:MAG: SOS response-associated peptidase [Sphingomonadaceae bacterium]
MCGRYVSPDTAAIERAWHVGRGNSNPFARRFNVLPTTSIPIIRGKRETGELELAEARWGLIPSWWKQDKPPTYSINARAEEAATKPMWRDAYRRARCLIPAEGWYEWKKVGERKQPHYIFRRDRRLVCFAGLMAEWTNEGGVPLASCAILTRDASPSVADVHDRMPVVLPDELLVRWARADVQRPEEVASMVRLAQSEFEHYAVSARLNSAKDDRADMIERV